MDARRTICWMLSPLALLAVGCGDVAGPDYQGTELGRVHGQLLTSSSAPAVTNLKMAISWLNASTAEALPIVAADPSAQPPDGGYGTFPHWEDFTSSCGSDPVTTGPDVIPNFEVLNGTLESVAYQPSFPVQFQIPLHNLPPASSLLDLSTFSPFSAGSGTIALGMVLAYDDVNGDGKLNQGTVATPGEPVVASSFGYDTTYLVYLDGQLRAGGLPLAPGFSFVTLQGGLAATVSPTSAALTLTMGEANSGDLATGVLGCSEVELDSSVWQTQQPAGADVFCARNNQSYAWRKRTVAGCVSHESSGVVCRDASAPAPANWPCP